MAKRKEVLLVKDVLKLGNMGDVVRVSPGFARNYLYPFGMAVPAEGAAKRQIEVLREKAAKSEIEREGKAHGLKKSMEGMTIQVAARVAHELELFGSIVSKEIVTVLAKRGIELDTQTGPSPRQDPPPRCVQHRDPPAQERARHDQARSCE